MSKEFSLVFVYDEEREMLLLGRKLRGFATGKWNGYGGKLEPGETMLQCAQRELMEESGLVADKLEHVCHARVEQRNVDSIESFTMDLYLCTEWQGDPQRTEEMDPRWFNYGKAEGCLPFAQMHPEAPIYLPALIHERKRFDLTLVWDGETLIHYDILDWTR